MFSESWHNHFYFIFWKKRFPQPQFEYFKFSPLIFKYAKSTNKFQIYLVFWVEFNFLQFQQIFLNF
jgi:hypothetical protein